MRMVFNNISNIYSRNITSFVLIFLFHQYEYAIISFIKAENRINGRVKL